MYQYGLGLDIYVGLADIWYFVFSASLWSASLQWRHNDYDSVSNHQPHGCLLNRLFRPRSKKTSKLRVTGLCVGNSPGPVNSPHKVPVTRKMFPFDDVIMMAYCPTQAHVCYRKVCDDIHDMLCLVKKMLETFATLLAEMLDLWCILK